MGSIEEKLLKLREERIAREKARIEKLRQLNLQKYSNSASSSIVRAPAPNQANSLKSVPAASKKNGTHQFSNSLHVNGTSKRPVSVPEPGQRTLTSKVAPRKSLIPSSMRPAGVSKVTSKIEINNKHFEDKRQIKFEKNIPDGNNGEVKRSKGGQNVNTISEIGKINEKRIAPAPSTSGAQSKLNRLTYKTKLNTGRSSVPPQRVTQDASNPKRMSVFERLYQPKPVPKVTISEAEKLRTDPAFLKKVIENATLITGKRHSIAQTNAAPVRRSISAVHLKRAHKSELKSCIHSWASSGKLDKLDINEVDEDDYIRCEKVVSAVKSETKKVKFQTPVTTKFNTPKPEELQARLQNWLQKRGKSIDSYHHLQCFGIFHLTKGIRPIGVSPRFDYDEENKENIALESDSDDQSFTENLNNRMNDFPPENKEVFSKDKWRRASYVSDSLSFNESKNTTLTSADDAHQVDELVVGALNDLTELLREGFDWEQCARWLRAIRERFPSAPEGSAYWECRAALEEHRGDMTASMQCWEEAIAMGTERSVADANLDQLLDKFMQLKISPNSGRHKQVDPKMVDVKNVLKSTIIRFAVQKAKLRRSSQNHSPKYTVTPVRRSARLSIHGSQRTPSQVCTTITQASTLGHRVVFKRNEQLFGTP